MLFISLLFFTNFLSAVEPISLKQDPYNALIWNSHNYNKNNQRIDTGPWYEWWYAKFVDPKTNEAILFSYGIVNPWDTAHSNPASNAFVSVGSFKDNKVFAEKFPVSSFHASYEKTDVRIAQNIFRENEISGEMQTPNEPVVKWNLSMKKIWSFNAMGWGMFLREIINIYWYPAQASATMSGFVKIGDRTIEIENVNAYQDRNWGRSFPKWWAWIVSNDFDNSPGTALVAGGGQPKILKITNAIKGMNIGLLHNGKEYSFKLNSGISQKMKINFGTWEIESTNLKNEKIIISAFAEKNKFMVLPFPTPEGTVFKDYEALQGELRVKLFKKSKSLKSNKSKWNLIADLVSHNAGIEWGAAENEFE